MSDKKKEENKNGIMYAIIAVLAVLIVITFIIAMIALFNTGTQGAQGPQGPPGRKGDTGAQGTPGKNGSCDCLQGGIQPISTPPTPANIKADLAALKVDIQNLIASLSDAQKQAILASPQYDAISSYIKNLVAMYNQGQQLMVNSTYTLSQLLNWISNNAQMVVPLSGNLQNFYNQWMNGQLSFVSLDLTDPNVNYLIYLLNTYMKYRDYNFMTPISLTPQQKIDLLTMLISKYPSAAQKILKMMFNEILSLSTFNVNLKNFASIVKNLQLGQDLLQIYNNIMQNDNVDDDVVYVSSLSSYTIDSNEDYIFNGIAKKAKNIKIYVDGAKNMDFTISNQGANIILKLVFYNVKNMMVPNGEQGYLMIKPNQTRNVMTMNGNATIE